MDREIWSGAFRDRSPAPREQEIIDWIEKLIQLNDESAAKISALERHMEEVKGAVYRCGAAVDRHDARFDAIEVNESDRDVDIDNNITKIRKLFNSFEDHERRMLSLERIASTVSDAVEPGQEKRPSDDAAAILDEIGEIVSDYQNKDDNDLCVVVMRVVEYADLWLELVDNIKAGR